MLNNNVVISIRGVQTYDDMDDQIVELVTEGRYKRIPEGFSLSYEESKLTGLEGTLTTFDISNHTVTLTRTGDLMSQMVFEEGKKHYSVYETAYGAFTVGIASALVRHELDESGGEISVDYSVEIDHAMTGNSSFHIKIREN